MKYIHGECHCGCKGIPKIAKINRHDRGDVKGLPVKFIKGHGSVKPRPKLVQPEDPSIRHIALTQGQIAIVSAHRYNSLAKHNWVAHWCDGTASFYASRRVKGKDNR